MRSFHQEPIEPVLGRTMWVPHQEQQINNKNMTDSKQNGSNQEKVAFNRTRIGVQPRNIQGQTLLQLKPKKHSYDPGSNWDTLFEF